MRTTINCVSSEGKHAGGCREGAMMQLGTIGCLIAFILGLLGAPFAAAQTRKVARAIDARSRFAICIGDEAFGRLRGASVIAARKARAA